MGAGRRAEDGDLGEQAHQARGEARQAEEEEREGRRGEGAGLRQAAIAVEVRPADRVDDGEGTEVHSRVHDDVGDGRADVLRVVGRVVHCQGDEDVAGLADGGPGEEADRVGLAEGDQVAEGHRQGGEAVPVRRIRPAKPAALETTDR